MGQSSVPPAFKFKKLVKDLVITSPSTPSSGPAQLSVSSTTLDFNAIAVGSSKSLTVLVTNSGQSVLSGINVTEASSSFSSQSNCLSTLNPGDTCLVTVDYTPLSLSPHSASLTVASSAGNKIVSLSGSGVGAFGNLQPNSTSDFGSVAINSSLSTSFTFTNEGNTASLNTYATVTGVGLTLGQNNCGTSTNPISVSPGGSCQYYVVYTPESEISLTGTTQVLSSAINSPSSLSLTGRGTKPESPIAVLSTDTLTVTTRQGESASESVVLLNSGNSDLILSQPPSISQAPATGFSSTTNCGNVLGSNSTCSVTVTYTSADLAEKQATLQFNTNDGLKSVLLKGVTQAALTAKVSSVLQSQQAFDGDFGTVEVGSTGIKNIYILPSGTYGSLQSSAQIVGSDSSSFKIESVSKYLVSYSNEFWASSASCGAEVSVNSSTLCQADALNSTSSSARRNQRYVVSFNPTGEGAKSATLVLTNNGYNTSPISVTLAGVGSATPTPSLSNSSVDFGVIDLNTTSSPSVITLTNNGIGTLYLTGAPELKGVDSANYSLSTNCGSVLAPNAHCETSIGFNPTSAGVKSAYIEYTSSNTTIPNVTLTGTTGISTASLSPAANNFVDFGQTPVTSQKSYIYTYTNTGTKVLTNVIAELSNSSDFYIHNGLTTCGKQASPTSLNPGQTCSVVVYFTPMHVAEYSSVLSVSSSATNNVPGISLTGSGISGDEFYSTFDTASYTAETGGTGVYSSGGNVASFTGGSLLFTAASTTSSGYVQYPSSTAYTPVGPGDFEVEVKFNRQADNGTFSGGIFSLYSSGSAFMDIYMTASSSIGMQLNSGSANYISTMPNSIYLNNWYTIKVTKKNGTVTMTLNGQPAAIATCTSAGACGTYSASQPLATNLTATYAIRLGNRGFSNTRPFRGYIDYVRYSKNVQ